MIGYIKGIVLQRNKKSILVMTSSEVGYEIFVSMARVSQNIGSPIELFIQTIVREQEISLYGFENQNQQIFFQKLIGVSGVGPKTALQILDQDLGKLVEAIEKGDATFVSKTPGIGKKTAEKIIIELGGALDLQEQTNQSNNSEELQLALDAIQNLGYRRKDAEELLSKAENKKTCEEYIKFFLQSK